MLLITKIFRFETAHAIAGYEGPCKNIHGHSYELHVKVGANNDNEYLPAPGFIIDFKDLKKIVYSSVVNQLDHKLILSENFLKLHPHITEQENLVVWKIEPTAENLLLYIRKNIIELLPANIILAELKLYETKDSYAEWKHVNL